MSNIATAHHAAAGTEHEGYLAGQRDVAAGAIKTGADLDAAEAAIFVPRGMMPFGARYLWRSGYLRAVRDAKRA